MGNPSYDVDDILNEVRKRRMEQEDVIRNGNAEKSPAAFDETDTEQHENSAAEKPVMPKKEKSNGHESDALQKNAGAYKMQEKSSFNVMQEEKAKTADDGEVDLFSISGGYNADTDLPSKNKRNGRSADKKKKRSKRIKTAVCIVLAAAIVLSGCGIFAFNYYNKLLNNATDTPEPAASTEEWHGMDKLVEDFTPIYEDSSSDISSYKNMVKKWYYNGKPVSSTHVLNVLLIGEDTRDNEIIEEDTRADSAIIASVNIDTGEIVLTSILRDAYCYWEKVEGDKTTGEYGKINGAMSTGGLDCYIRTVENMYKINIDNYAIVNFSSFERIVDILGGVDIEMTQKEINEINNHQKRYNHVQIIGEPGVLHLRGDEALAYCRIRKIDSDGARADRQKTVLLQLFQKAKQASSIKAVEVITELLPYVKTGFNKSELISIAKYALTHGWLQYKTSTYTVPNDEELTGEDGKAIKGCVGGTFYGTWIWKVDYPLYSQITQNRIYGKTSIVLAEKRPKFDKLK